MDVNSDATSLLLLDEDEVLDERLSLPALLAQESRGVPAPLLAAFALPELGVEALDEPRVIYRQRGAVGERLGKPLIVLGVRPRVSVAPQAQRTDDPAASPQSADECRVHTHRAEGETGFGRHRGSRRFKTGSVEHKGSGPTHRRSAEAPALTRRRRRRQRLADHALRLRICVVGGDETDVLSAVIEQDECSGIAQIERDHLDHAID